MLFGIVAAVAAVATGLAVYSFSSLPPAPPVPGQNGYDEFVRIGTAISSSFRTYKTMTDNPLSAGIGKEELRVGSLTPGVVFDSAVGSLARAMKIEIAGEVVRLPGRGVELKDDEAESKARIEAAFASTGLKVPALHEVLAGIKLDKQRAQKIVTLLLREKVLMKISDDLVFHRSALDDLRRRIAQQKSKTPRMDVSQFKELTGVSRKYAIPLLEYLDRERVTRRIGDAREIL